MEKSHGRSGSIELEYEGAPEFLGDGLNKLLEHVATISRAVPAESLSGSSPLGAEEGTTEPIDGAAPIQLSTATIAGRLGVRTGPDLAIAAMAHLEFVKQLQSYSRKEILDEMKTATGMYDKNMSSNLSRTLQTLVKNKRIKDIGGSYSLSADERSKIEAALANAQ